jgi:hypothetical protein
LEPYLEFEVNVFVDMGEDAQADQRDTGGQLMFLVGIGQVVVVNNHLRDVNGSFCIDLKIEFLSEFVDAEHLTQCLDEFIQGRDDHIEIESHENLGLFVFDLEGIDLVVSDLVLHRSDADRVDFLILGRHEHARDPCWVDVLDLHRTADRFVVVVHEMHGEKKGLVMTVVTVHDFDHPVDHFGAQVRCDLLELQTLLIILIILD